MHIKQALIAALTLWMFLEQDSTKSRTSPWIQMGIKDQRKTPCICMVFFFGIGWLPIFPTQFRNGRAALRVEALPCVPLLIGCSSPCIRHRRRSAPSHHRPSNTYGILLKYKPGKVGGRRKHKKQDALLCVLLLWYPAATYLSGSAHMVAARRTGSGAVRRWKLSSQ